VQRILRLLSDPTRLRILAAVEPEELSVGEIADVLGMSQPRISNHLRLLRDASALRGRRDGSWTFYRNALADQAEGGALWRAVRQGLAGDEEVRGDASRRALVLARRRQRSREHFRAAAGASDPALETGTLHHEMLSALLTKGGVAVDAGCGEGQLCEVLAPRYRRVIAVDYSDARLRRARERLDGSAVEFHRGEVDALPLRDGCADALFLSLVLHHVPQLGAALGEAFRVLRPGAPVVVADLASHDLESMREAAADLRLGLDPPALARALRHAGFREVRLEPVRDRLLASPDRPLKLFLAAGRRPRTLTRRKRPRSTRAETGSRRTT